ncbi:MAG: type III-B CRISPR module RAMP protein Cmr4 [Deltaproteobacteria bacterium]|nr:type III-B CRISPR module RAMP protein Cmr4 [Deltaproteobacteria bacterium]
MFTKGKLLFLYCESLVHAGAGSGAGSIDLPIQREKITQWPIFQFSGLKGSLRDHYESLSACNNDELFAIFGPDSMKNDSANKPGNPADNSGAISLSDAMLLLFPVGSLKGTFAYITCPLAVKRLVRGLKVIGMVDQRLTGAAGLSIRDQDILLPSNNGPGPYQSILALSSNQVVLEESQFNAMPSSELKGLAQWIENCRPAQDIPWVNLPERLAMVSDEMFKYFVEFSTEVLTRNRIDDQTGTVKDGALWTEECLPREALLYSFLLTCTPRKKNVKGLASDHDVMKYVSETHAPTRIWLGGDVTGGRGLLRTFFASGKAGTTGGTPHV